MDVTDVNALRDAVTNVYVDKLLQRWIVQLVRATRELDEVAVGASLRGSLALERAARAWALLVLRDNVVRGNGGPGILTSRLRRGLGRQRGQRQ